MKRRESRSSYYFSGFKDLSEGLRRTVLASITTLVLLAGGCVAQHQMTAKAAAPPDTAFEGKFSWDWLDSCTSGAQDCWSIDVQTTKGCPHGVDGKIAIVTQDGILLGHAEDSVGPLLVGQKAHMEFTPSTPLTQIPPGKYSVPYLTSLSCVEVGI